jgi:DNA (cytosine-5)-methyltransferase 1
MTRPRLLDLFSGAGGCSVGYHRAGFDVIGIDIAPHPDYPYVLVVDDAVAAFTCLLNGGRLGPYYLHDFDVVHASPPCPRFSSITPAHTRDTHPDLLTPTRELLRLWGGAYVIENVPGAPLDHPALYCGKAMGLPHLRRHRLFESNVFLMTPGCLCDNGPAYGVYGDHGEKTPRQHPDGFKRWGKARDAEHAREIMGIDWMTRWDDLADAIPPAYTQHIGEQLLHALEVAS